MRRPVSIVIPAYNSGDLLLHLLPQLLHLTRLDRGDEIIVVDDCSKDDSVRTVEAKFPAASIIRNERNRGFAHTVNTGVGHAKNTIFMLLNTDISLPADFSLDPFVTMLESDETIFSITPKIIRKTPDGLRNESVPEVGLKKSGFDLNVLTLPDKYDRPRDILYPCGGASFFDRDKFLKIGGLDTLYSPFYFEDFDLGLRAWRMGWKCIYEPSSSVNHAHQGTIGTFNRRYVKLVGKRNYYLCLWKNFPSSMIFPSMFQGIIVSALKFRKYEILGIFWAMLKVKEIFRRKTEIIKEKEVPFEEVKRIFYHS
ncbi:MAG: glycosyltransferase [Deltaproteobacteria bacterium]|nr:glycosyltransferase [Deltaproteobacteria bacterium]